MNSNVFLLLRERNTIKAARGTLQCQSVLLLFQHLPGKCVFCQSLEMGRFCDEVFQPLQPSRFHTDGQIVSPVEAFCWVNLFTVHDDAVVYSISDMTFGQVWWPILRICALHLTHPTCTHTAVNTHTPWTHTRSSGQSFMLRHPGSSWWFGALLKDTSVVVLRVERALYIHSSTYNSCRPETRTHNLSITSPTL